MPSFTHHIFICTNERAEDHPRGSCAQKGAKAICDSFKQELRKANLTSPSIRANSSGCLNQCEQGPSVVVYPEQIWYTINTIEQVKEVVKQHIQKGQPVEHVRMQEILFSE